MFDPEQYQLLDFGNGEKLERFGNVVVRRETPSVAADSKRSGEVDWNSGLRFKSAPGSQSGKWSGAPPSHWKISHGGASFLLKPTPAGQVGIFPEQVVNWDWIDSLSFDWAGLTALNLFGYTGGTTMAIAAKGASVVHIDAANNVMKWARENAAAASLQDHPIRWIVEDALKFVQRELNRGRKYDILVADPPSFGTGPQNERWKITEHLNSLLEGMASITSSRLRMLLFSCHTPGFDHGHLQDLAEQHFDLLDGQLDAFPLELNSVSGKRLTSGHCCRFAALK